MNDKQIVNIWGVESSLYPIIDANGMRSNSSITNSFNLGNNHFVDVKINNLTKNSISNQSIVSQESFKLGLNFRKGKVKWFRIDNHSVGFLHFHLQSEKNEFKEHQKLHDKFTVAELISFTFDWLRNVIIEKYPETKIIDSEGFVGTA